MRKDLGVLTAVFPMPVLMVASYDEEGTPDVMNAAWGMICDYDKVALFLAEDHQTTRNILNRKAFTVALADKAHVEEADFAGIVSAATMPDKFARSGLKETKSTFVDAPVIEEFPVCMECELAEVIDTPNMYAVVGKIVNVNAREDVLDENGKIDITKMQVLTFDPFKAGYYVTGPQAGEAWRSGKVLMEKEDKE